MTITNHNLIARLESNIIVNPNNVAFFYRRTQVTPKSNFDNLKMHIMVLFT